MEHFRIGTRTALSVPGAGVVLLIFRLVGDAVDDHIVHLHVTITFIIGKGHAKLSGGVGAHGVIQHADTQRPGFDRLATNFEADAFVAGHATHAHGHAVVTAGIGAAGTA